MKKRYNIGFFVHHLENDYSRVLMRGVTCAAEDLDVNLIIYPGRALNGEYYDDKYAQYEYQNNVLYSFAAPGMIDGLIISAGTIGSFVSHEEFKTFVDRFEGIPVLTIENPVRGYPCLHFGSSGIRLIINHLVSEHNCRRIAFISGPKGNGDAESRLDAYRSALAENGLDFDETLIGYGNFSEYSVEAVDEMLDGCTEMPDAICFANDQMCIGGYEAVRKRGLEPGKDILITGYDDSEVAASLSPMLTTVRADSAELGYTAVEEMYKWLRDGIAPETRELTSTIVLRGSCGCGNTRFNADMYKKLLGESGVEECSRTIVSMHAGSGISVNAKRLRAGIAGFIGNIFTAAESGGDISEKKLTEQFSRLLDDGIAENLGYDTVSDIIYASQAFALSMLGRTSARHIRIICMFEKFEHMLSDHVLGATTKRNADLTSNYYLIGNITKNMLMHADEEDKCFYAIINNLCRVHIMNGYVYIYDKPIINTPDSEWRIPETMNLKAYNIGSRLCTLNGKDQVIAGKNFFENRYSPADMRRTVVLSPLYSAEVQFGLLVCDLDYEFFSNIYSVSPQICTAINMLEMLKKVKGPLAQANDTDMVSSRLSMSDELTGAYNRRGFYKYANLQIQSSENDGLTGVLIYGDLDDLKRINDIYGRGDGDYAINCAAEYLKKGLRSSDVIARIGGDEFAALAVVSDDSFAKEIYSRIKSIADEHNKTSGKPYNVRMSIGVYTFKCSEKVHVQDYLDKADAALYYDKKKKSSDLLKKNG